MCNENLTLSEFRNSLISASGQLQQITSLIFSNRDRNSPHFFSAIKLTMFFLHGILIVQTNTNINVMKTNHWLVLRNAIRCSLWPQRFPSQHVISLALKTKYAAQHLNTRQLLNNCVMMSCVSSNSNRLYILISATSFVELYCVFIHVFY